MGSEKQQQSTQLCIKIITSAKLKKLLVQTQQQVFAESVTLTSINSLESFFVDLATALFSAVDIRRPAFGRLQLLACTRSIQLPLGQEVPR